MKAGANSKSPKNGPQNCPPHGDESAAKQPTDPPRGTDGEEPDALKALQRQFGELGEYCSYYLAAKIDSMKLALRSSGIQLAVGVLGFMALAALIATAVWLLVSG